MFIKFKIEVVVIFVAFYDLATVGLNALMALSSELVSPNYEHILKLCLIKVLDEGYQLLDLRLTVVLGLDLNEEVLRNILAIHLCCVL